MNKIIILAFALAITAHAACPNALGDALSIAQENTEQASFASANLVCASLNTGAISCCLKATVDAFKTQGETLVSDLETASETKDALILAARKKIADLRTEFTALSDAYTTAVQTKLTTLTTGGNTVAGTVKTFLDAYVDDITAFFATYSDLRTGFTTYQTARGTCLTALVKAEVSAWCLACNTNAETIGVDNSGASPVVDYDTALITSLRTACYPYIAASAQQTDILRLAHFAAPVATYTSNLLLLADSDDTNDATAVTAINTAIPSGSATGISVIPTGCTSTACTWITTDLLPPATVTIDQTKAILGGDVPTRRILQESRSSGRMLAGNFAPAADEVKITTLTVEANPGDVENPNDLSALRVGVLSCIVAFFVALLI